MHVPKENPTAIHSVTEQGDHVVGFGKINVLLIEEDDCWYAHGLEVDYTAQGSSFDDAKRNFETGFLSTIHANIQKHGSIAPLLVPAPPELWKETLSHPDATARRFSCMSIHLEQSLRDLMEFIPFDSINYLQAGAHG